MTSMTEAEILVIGGGIAGVSAALHLAGHGRRVVLLERGEIASAASGVNMGGIDSYGLGDAPDLQAQLTAGSLEIFKDVQLEHGEVSTFSHTFGIAPTNVCFAYFGSSDFIELGLHQDSAARRLNVSPGDPVGQRR